METEGDDIEIGWRNEADDRGGSKMMRRGIELGGDVVAGDIERGTLTLSDCGKGDQKCESEGQRYSPP